ncbi:UNVERIFIED_CONTAM: hypothetical protein Sradi_6622700 [Sesamum radiatum]|uniref:Uncharacterized protein n=1 Tax=Sesamum radiatum TaxID=300843 RepID=A0AAW2JYS5_SESRA
MYKSVTSSESCACQSGFSTNQTALSSLLCHSSSASETTDSSSDDFEWKSVLLELATEEKRCGQGGDFLEIEGHLGGNNLGTESGGGARIENLKVDMVGILVSNDPFAARIYRVDSVQSSVSMQRKLEKMKIGFNTPSLHIQFRSA